MRRLSIFLTVIVLTSCVNKLNKPINSEDLADIAEHLNESELHQNKRSYILSELQATINLMNMGIETPIVTPTFEEAINELSFSYDSIVEINTKLDSLVTLVDASCFSVDEYDGILTLHLDLNSRFDKEILYAILEYKYVDEYDKEYFSTHVRLTDQTAVGFNETIEVSYREEYTDAAEFFYTEVPISARKTMRDSMGAEAANKKVMSDFLMKGLKVNTLGVVFKDKSEAVYMEGEYFN